MPIKNLPFGDFTREDSGPEIVGPAQSEGFVSPKEEEEEEAPGRMLDRWTLFFRCCRRCCCCRTTFVSKLEIPSSLISPKIPRRDAPARKLRGEVYFRACRCRRRGRDGRMFRTRHLYRGRKCVRIRRSWYPCSLQLIGVCIVNA